MTRDEAIFVLEHIEAHNELAKEAKLIAIDALKQSEIIRCKDCRFAEWLGPGLYMCRNDDIMTYDGYVSAMWYCADGEEKKTDE